MEVILRRRRKRKRRRKRNKKRTTTTKKMRRMTALQWRLPTITIKQPSCYVIHLSPGLRPVPHQFWHKKRPYAMPGSDFGESDSL